MHNCLQMKVDPKGPEASRLRQIKFEVVKRYHLPDDLLPGNFTETHRRCGRSNCHCAAEGHPGHPICFLTFMSDGNRRVERVPAEWSEYVRRQVAAGHTVQDDIKRMLASNAELLVLWRKQMGL